MKLTGKGYVELPTYIIFEDSESKVVGVEEGFCFTRF